jgi:tetratricopeptide (TPR) repeat protein
MVACLDSETIAALVDGRLTGEALAAARAHLESCEDCSGLAAELLLAVGHMNRGMDDEADEPSLMPLRPSRWARWPTALAGLAAAAAVGLTGWLQPGWLFPGAGDDPRLEALVAAAGPERPIEGRLTGGFAYGALRAPERSGAPDRNLRLEAAAGELQEAADRDPSPANLHAWGVALVALGRAEEGLDVLEAAALQGGMTAPLAADLGAARLAAATAADRPDQITHALAALEEANALDPALPEPWFTKAIVLERLRVPAQAAAAWRRYLALDASSGWSDEARRRLASVEQP